MAHAEVIQNGLVIVKPDPRLRRAIHFARQFLGRISKKIPGFRSLVRQEMLLRWLHKQVHDFAERQRYRGKQVYIVLDEKILSGTKDFVALVRDNAKSFLAVGELEGAIRNAFGLIERERTRDEIRKKSKKKVQTFKPIKW